MELIFRGETPEDIDAIRVINTLAFERTSEADLVDTLRLNARPFLSIVAEQGGSIVGHLAFSPVTLDDRSGEELPIFLGLAPVAVHPDRQRQGIGSSLIRLGLGSCQGMRVAAVFVLGHPSYYPRFGFEVAARRGLRCEYEVPEEAFLVAELIPGALDGRSGTVRYHEAFASV